MTDYSYLSAEPQPDPSLPQLGTEMLASFVPGLGQVQALRDYLRAGKSGDKLGQVLSALGTVPGVGAVTKASLLLPAMLRREKPAVKALNETLIPQHSSYIDNFTKSPTHLESPSFGLNSREYMTPFGNDNIDPLEMFPPGHQDYIKPRDLMFIGKPGALDPKNRVGSIFPSDAMTPSQSGKHMTLPERQEILQDAVRSWNEYNKKRPATYSFKEYLREILRNPIETGGAGFGELKLYQNLPISPENFSGAIMDERSFSSKLAQQLKERGLQVERGNLINDPEGTWDKANWLQQRSLK